MKINEAFDSAFLGAWDLDPDKPQTVTIVGVEREEVQLPSTSKTEMKVVISLKGAQKRWIVNKTNSRTLFGLFGRETDTWAGKKVELYVANVNLKGKQVPAVRVRGVQQ